jgi:hypothetical protein
MPHRYPGIPWFCDTHHQHPHYPETYLCAPDHSPCDPMTCLPPGSLPICIHTSNDHSTRTADFTFAFACTPHHVADWGQSVSKSLGDVGSGPSLGRYSLVLQTSCDHVRTLPALSGAVPIIPSTFRTSLSLASHLEPIGSLFPQSGPSCNTREHVRNLLHHVHSPYSRPSTSHVIVPSLLVRISLSLMSLPSPYSHLDQFMALTTPLPHSLLHDVKYLAIPEPYSTFTWRTLIVYTYTSCPSSRIPLFQHRISFLRRFH